MKKQIRTPKGALLGISTEKNGEKAIEYKAGHRTEILTSVELVEALTGWKVEKIVFAPKC